MRIILTLILILIAQPSFAQVVNVRWDRAWANTEIFGKESKDNWSGVEIEVGYEFKEPKVFVVSGLTFGYRHEKDYAYGGHHVFGRIYRIIPVKKVNLSVSGAIVYGLPSSYRYRSWEVNNGRQEEYYYLHPLRGLSIPGDPIKDLGSIYPEFTIGVRSKFFKYVMVEPFTGVRLLRYGAVKSTDGSNNYFKFTEFAPVIGVRIGI